MAASSPCLIFQEKKKNAAAEIVVGAAGEVDLAEPKDEGRSGVAGGDVMPDGAGRYPSGVKNCTGVVMRGRWENGEANM